MFEDKTLKELHRLSRESSKKMNLELRILDKTLDETLKNVPDEHKSEIEKVKALSQKSIYLAKDGKLKKAQELIKKFRDGRKSN